MNKQVNFFSKKCKTTLRDELFGICDDSDDKQSKISYSNIRNEYKWIARVENNNKYEVKFIAIDDCVSIFKEDGKPDKSCDAMMIYNKNIIFIELKNRDTSKRSPNWLKDGIKQLINTIKYFNKRYSSLKFRKKIAYVANKKHPHFNSFSGQQSQYFKETTGFTLKTKAIIKL